MSAVLEQEIAALEDLDLEGLRRAWALRYGAAPRLRSSELLRLMLAWRMQTEVLGGLSAETRRQLKRKGRIRAEGLEFGPGSVLKREWQGRIVAVQVEADGFRWDGQRYRSLSAVATAIAGTHWNGPRFFGLRQAS